MSAAMSAVRVRSTRGHVRVTLSGPARVAPDGPPAYVVRRLVWTPWLLWLGRWRVERARVTRQLGRALLIWEEWLS